MANYLFGLKSVKFGTPESDGTMPASLTVFAQTVRGSMTLSETEAAVQDFNVEEQDSPVEQAITESSKLEATWRAYDLSPAVIAKVKGGTAGTSPDKWSAPTKSVLLKLALEIETDNGTKIQIPYANVQARFDGTIGREDMLQLEVKATALSPGANIAPFAIEFPTVPADPAE